MTESSLFNRSSKHSKPGSSSLGNMTAESNIHKQVSLNNMSSCMPASKKAIDGFSTKGKVMSLKPSIPIVCKPSATIYQAAQLMIASKENCVLVIDDNEELAGIFTAKDLAFRVVGSRLDAKSTTINHIMTPNPLCAKTIAKASDALNLMVVKSFRHLPVVNDENQIVGILDITKCYNEAMNKLEAMYENSKKLYEAMETVNLELGGGKQPNAIIRYVENLKKLLSGPTLIQVLNDERTIPIYCRADTPVHDAAMLMKKNKTTAVLIKDEEDEEVKGIFTSKDIVTRVIAVNLDPLVCPVSKVMTLKPAYAKTSCPISKALRQMFEGKYLNLPVVDEKTDEIVGIVDVIRLTHYTLNQIQTMESLSEDNEEDDEIERDDIINQQPLNDFWKTFDHNDNLECDCDDSSFSSIGDVSVDELAQFNIASMDVDDTASNIRYKDHVPRKMSSLLSLAPVDYDETCFFKFKRPGGRIHRISYKPSNGVRELHLLVKEALTDNELKMFKNETFGISYLDQDGDMVIINTDKDLKDCVLLMRNLQRDKVDIEIHDTDEILLGRRGKMGNHAQESENHSNYLLPAALFTLAATIIVVFSVSRKN